MANSRAVETGVKPVLQSMGLVVWRAWAWAGAALPLGLLGEKDGGTCVGTLTRLWPGKGWVALLLTSSPGQLDCQVALPHPLKVRRGAGGGWRLVRCWNTEVGQEACPCLSCPPSHGRSHGGGGRGPWKFFSWGPPWLSVALANRMEHAPRS